jgi:hypothetical protein
VGSVAISDPAGNVPGIKFLKPGSIYYPVVP